MTSTVTAKNLSPSSDQAQDLGMPSSRWKTAYIKEISDGQGSAVAVSEVASAVEFAAEKNHNELTSESRSAAGCHPIAAITGLSTKLGSYLPLSGGTITGTLNLPKNGIVFPASHGKKIDLYEGVYSLETITGGFAFRGFRNTGSTLFAMYHDSDNGATTTRVFYIANNRLGLSNIYLGNGDAVAPSGNPTYFNVRNEINAKAPLPRQTTTSTPGQWVPLTAEGESAILPSGGTWAYFCQKFDLGSRLYAGAIAGVAAGGTTVDSSSPGYLYSGFAWRIS